MSNNTPVNFHPLFSPLAIEDDERLSAEQMDERRRQNIAYEYLCHLEEAKRYALRVGKGCYLSVLQMLSLQEKQNTRVAWVRLGILIYM